MSDDNGNVLSTIPPEKVSRIHLVGVGGTGMGSFAGMLKAAGFQVTGSDQNLYPPMSDMLKAWGIEALSPYAAQNLDVARPDLVIIGNVIRRINPEATAVRERGLPQMSFPAALGALFLQTRHSVVVAGTHGKTTTSSLMAHVLVEAKKDPSFLVGGVTQNYAGNYRLGQGPHFVIEGDEYDTAYFDKGPKFLHYRPQTAILTSVEFDHADIYRDLAHYESAFEKFIALLPQGGTLAVSASYPNAVRMAHKCAAQVLTYSASANAPAQLLPEQIRFSEEGASFEVRREGKLLGQTSLPMGGMHNVENALGVLAAALSLGLSFEEVSRAFSTFRGVKRRQELRAEVRGTLVVDDFAHHPTAVRETVSAICRRYPGRQVWAVFEPRSNTSRRNIHQEEYARAFAGAARVTLKTPEKHDQVPDSEGLDIPKLVQALESQGLAADAGGHVDELVERVASKATSTHVILVMSNGSFGGFIDKLIARLQATG